MNTLVRVGFGNAFAYVVISWKRFKVVVQRDVKMTFVTSWRAPGTGYLCKIKVYNYVLVQCRLIKFALQIINECKFTLPDFGCKLLNITRVMRKVYILLRQPSYNWIKCYQNTNIT